VGPLPSPAEGYRGERCADVGDRRVCWGGGARVVPRPVPTDAAPAMGWRCDGTGATRVCEDRRHDSSAFACDAVGSCVQPEPRMPDDGEWECVDIDGVAYCHRTALASAVVPGPPDLGWLCGRRLRSSANEPICVDLSPDRPDARGWRCTFQYSNFYPTRVCVRSDASIVGGTCAAGSTAAASACPANAACVGGVCMPPEPSPNCWIDSDCDRDKGERCRWGTCMGGGA